MSNSNYNEQFNLILTLLVPLDFRASFSITDQFFKNIFLCCRPTVKLNNTKIMCASTVCLGEIIYF